VDGHAVLLAEMLIFLIAHMLLRLWSCESSATQASTHGIFLIRFPLRALEQHMLLVLIVAASENNVAASFLVVVALEAEAVHEMLELRGHVYELDPRVLAEAALSLELLDTGLAHDVIQTARALLWLHVAAQEGEADAASQEALQRYDLLTAILLLDLLLCRRV